ncbi:hypothetical protein O7603_16025 [Micromonospora sp. WMMD812]|nr:hypothetical protein [Micromonospora sp. WMMD812]WBB70770.1 hypothetical protein O7603_16025 [Micromonospora sp. WMMD812]
MAPEPVVATTDGLEGTPGQGGDVMRESVGRIGRVEATALDTRGIHRAKPLSQILRDQVFIDAPLKIRHSVTLTSRPLVHHPIDGQDADPLVVMRPTVYGGDLRDRSAGGDHPPRNAPIWRVRQPSQVARHMTGSSA